jgi:hypothetical protein
VGRICLPHKAIVEYVVPLSYGPGSFKIPNTFSGSFAITRGVVMPLRTTSAAERRRSCCVTSCYNVIPMSIGMKWIAFELPLASTMCPLLTAWYRLSMNNV